MSSEANKNSKSTVFNVPNQLTALRLLLSIVLFILLGITQVQVEAGETDSLSAMYWTALVIFTIAASTDWVDGYWARKYGQVTVLGRIFDPFVDKVIICGTFIFLAALPGSGITAWMAVVVVGRELLVTALRGFLEQQGVDFSASKAGKLKMVVQCVAVGVSMVSLAMLPAGDLPGWLQSTLLISVWSAVLITVYSGVEYLFAATRLIRGQ